MSAFDFNKPSGLFPSRNRKSNRPAGYRRSIPPPRRFASRWRICRPSCCSAPIWRSMRRASIAPPSAGCTTAPNIRSPSPRLVRTRLVRRSARPSTRRRIWSERALSRNLCPFTYPPPCGEGRPPERSEGGRGGGKKALAHRCHPHPVAPRIKSGVAVPALHKGEGRMRTRSRISTGFAAFTLPPPFAGRIASRPSERRARGPKEERSMKRFCLASAMVFAAHAVLQPGRRTRLLRPAP